MDRIVLSVQWIVALAAILIVGCAAQLFEPSTPVAKLTSVTGSGSAGDGTQVRKATDYPPLDLENTDSSGDALIQSVQQLEQIREIDTAAHKKLLGDLEKLPTEDWPLVVSNFHSALRYREQLAEEEGSQNQKVEEPINIVETNQPDTSSEAASGSVAPTVTLANHTHPMESPPPAAAPLSPKARQLPAVETHWQEQLSAALAGLATSSPSSSNLNEQMRLNLLKLAAAQSDPANSYQQTTSNAGHDDLANQFLALTDRASQQTELNDTARVVKQDQHAKEDSTRLVVHNLAFCKRVYGFGAYDEYPNIRFKAGQQLTLYTEVENSQSEMTDKGHYTSLATSYEVRDEGGRRVDSGHFPDVEDYCRNPRRDFHIQYGLSLPDRVSPGKYRLQLTVEDNQSKKIGQNELEFDIVAR